MIKCLLTE